MNFDVRPFFCACLLLSANAPALAETEDKDMVALSIGYFDIMDDQDASDFRIEYRPAYDLKIKNLRPFAAANLTSDASLWAGGGLVYDLSVTDTFFITPSIGVGLYAQGSSDKDLGHPIMFRSQIEASYQMDNNARLGIGFSHLSNASLDDQNPGTEVLSLYYHVPIDKIKAQLTSEE